MADKPTELEQAIAVALGDRLRELRKQTDLTQEALAHKANIARTTYQEYEGGRTSHGNPTNPTLKKLINIADVLDISVVELLRPVFTK